MTVDVVVVGGSLAALVAAADLAEAGQDVTMVKPGGAWGGYFAGFKVGDLTFDAGMVMLEFTAFAQQAGIGDIGSYDPAVRNDVGRFASVVQDWAASRFSTREISPLSMQIGGEILPDLIMGNDLAALTRLPFADATLAQLRSMPTVTSLHAREKARGEAYETCGFEAASRANHGDLFHDRLMAPFLSKVLGPHAEHLLARYHRIPWLPLYWPATLQAVLEGDKPPFDPSPLEYPVGSTVAGVVAALTSSLQGSSRVRMMDGVPIRLRPGNPGSLLELADGSILDARHLAWTHTPAALIQALGETPELASLRRAPLALALLTVPRHEARATFSVLQVVDPEFGLYRVTDLDVCAGSQNGMSRWVVEFNLQVFEARYGLADTDDQVLGQVVLELQKLGLIAAPEVVSTMVLKRIPGGFAVPDQESLRVWRSERATIDRLAPGIDLMGATSGFMVTSLNDQVVQGLKFSRKVQDALAT